MSCAHQFTTEDEKNAHILAHFEQRVCEDCDQNLLRIGDNFYVLHATLTCIRRCEIKQEIESDEQNHSELSRIKVHPIDARQYDNSYVKQEQTNDGSNQLDTMAVQIDPSSLAFQGPEFDETNKQLNSTILSTESNSNEKLYEKSKALMASLLNSLSAKEVPPKSPESPNRIKKYPCTYDGCNASYKTSSSRTLHIYRIHGSKRFECEECKKTFPTGSEFRRHVKTHGAQEKYSCDKCGMTNVSQRSLQRLHEHPKYKCDECGVAFCRHDQLRDHENYVHHKPLDISKCPVDGCNKMLTAAKRRDHMARMHKVIQHTCDVCQQIFTSFNQLREHMNDHGIKSQGYDCSHCGTTGISKETLENHHSKQNFTCKWCDRRFCLRTQLKQHHLQDSCKPETPISRSLANKLLKRYKCKVEGCNEMVSTNNRSYHMATKHTAKNEQFQCDICKKSAATKSMIRFHILRMHVPSSKKFKCNLCGKAYLSQSILDWHHTYSHVKEKKFMVKFIYF